MNNGLDERGSADWWDARYLSGDTPWDTGIVPPEVVTLVNANVRVPGLVPSWALDLGCGSGVSSRYLARHGYRVVGVDLAQSALARGEKSARTEGLAAYFCRGEVADLSFLRLRAAVALDVGCFHGLAPDRRPAYIASMADHLLPGAHYLLYAFEPQQAPEPATAAGVRPADIAGFAARFDLCRVRHGADTVSADTAGAHRSRPSAWYLLRRR